MPTVPTTKPAATSVGKIANHLKPLSRRTSKAQASTKGSSLVDRSTLSTPATSTATSRVATPDNERSIKTQNEHVSAQPLSLLDTSLAPVAADSGTTVEIESDAEHETANESQNSTKEAANQAAEASK